jgi:8-oxo-dGTP pyrophosphatase MutT (NUDIX family)
MKTSVAHARTIAAKKPASAQYAALPFRVNGESVEILLITSRRTRRWIVPKGWPIEGLGPAQSAAREALEEAGISGEVDKAPVGNFHYLKETKRGTSVPCRVELFALKVTRQHRTWMEKEEREQRWFPLGEAARSVGEPQLRRLILKFGARFAAGRP